jgi:gliding motility-associated-like protein
LKKLNIKYMLATMFLNQKNASPTLWESVGKGLLAKMQYACVALVVLFSFLGQQASAQTVTINAQPPVICDGNLATIFVTVTGLPSGVTVSDYEYFMEDPSTNPLGTVTSSQKTNTYSHLYKPGNYSPFVRVIFAGAGAPSPITSAPISITVYNRPIASFSIITQDTQCFKGNSVCFDNLSAVAPSPSNPLATSVWVYGNGFFDSATTTADQCHSYNAPGSYNVSLRVIDSKGCIKDTFLDAASPVVIKPPMNPAFSWLARSGPCFVSNYLFTNTTPVPLANLSQYTYDFGDGTSYTADAPFDATETANYDTLGHDYTINGEFNPGLIIADLTGCIDSIRYTNANTSTAIPKNIRFEFDVVTTKSGASSETRDSVCIGSYNSSAICFKQTPISFVSPGTGDFVWNFDDPASMQLNFDIQSWNPCHTFQGGMKTYYVTLTINNVCGPIPIRHTFFSAATFEDDRYIDKYIYANNDLLDPNSRPRLNFDTTVRPGFVQPPRKLVYAGSYQLSAGSVLGQDTLFAYSDLGKRSPVYYISNDTLLFTPAGVRKDTIDLPTNFLYLKPKVGTVPLQYDTFAGYRYYGYGARVIGPFARIEKPMPPPPVVIAPHHLNQCGPSDTVDFVNTSLSYKSRKIYRLWDFDDNFAPQCTSFTVPMAGYPPIASIQPLDSVTYDNGKTYMKFGPDTTRLWVDAMQQFRFSDHYFIANGQTYGGKVNCKFSYDTLPRHHYPNWDSVYRFYQYGHDFMPWDPARYGNGPGRIPVHPSDTFWWNKPVFLNPVTGEWSLTQGTGPSPYGSWVRIDTIGWEYNNGQDLRAGEPIQVTNLPDPFRQGNVGTDGKYPVVSGGQVEPGKNLRYGWKGKVYTINGSEILPDGITTFYQYAFRRTITRCITVRLNLQDSFNNESLGATDPDSTVIDKEKDCKMEGTVQLPFAKADARGLAKRGKECPGGSPNGVFFMMSGMGTFPGLVPSCGQTFILFNYDSLGDRMDGTPCALDAFTTYLGGVTPGGQAQLPFFSQANFAPPSIWTSPSGTTIAYHYGLNAPAGRRPPADTAQGWITVGIAIGSGCKDSLIRNVPISIYRANEAFYKTDITTPVIYPPGASVIPGMPTDYVYKFTQLKNYRPVFIGPGNLDTLVDVEYQDCNYAKCMSDTVWYHRFMRINNLTAKFEVEPANCRLRHKGEEITVHYEDTIQDDIKYSVWQWGDNTLTVDSIYYLADSFDVCLDTLRTGVNMNDYYANIAFYQTPITAPIPTDMQVQGGASTYNFSFNGFTNISTIFNGVGFDTVADVVYTDCSWSNGYYINGVRRVRYNFDIDSGDPVLLDSTVWPVRASGIGATDGLKPGVLLDSIRRDNFNRIFIVEDRTLPGKIAVLDKCTGLRDTMFVADTMNYYPIVQIIDSALAFFPVKHIFKRTSWEVADKQPGASTGNLIHLIGSKDPQNCFQVFGEPITIGIIDSFDIFNSKGEPDTLFCENEPVYFVDSLRYFRYDCQVTDLPFVPAVSNSQAYFGPLGPPYDALQIDSADFWRQDIADPRTVQNIIPVLPEPIFLISNVVPSGTVHGEYRLNWQPSLNFPRGTIVKWDTSAVLPFPQWVAIPTSDYKGTLLIDTVVPERVYWDFGDGSPIDSSQRPVHRYKNYGRYTVTMYSRDSLGWFDTCVAYVNISRPVAKIDFLRDGNGDPITTFSCGVLAQFLDSSKMATTPGLSPSTDSIKTNYWWFGDKIDTTQWQSTNNPNPAYRYRSNGTFRLKLVSETYQGCRDTTTDTIFISGPRPMIQLMVQTDTIGCAPFKVKILNLADSLGKQVDANGVPITDTVTKTTYIYWGDKNNSQSVVLGRRDTIEFTYDTAGVYYIYALGSDGENGAANICDLVLYPDTPNMPPIRLEVIQLKREVLLDKDVVCVDQQFQITNNSDTLYTQYTYIYENAAGSAIDSTVKAQQSSYTFPHSFDAVGGYRIIARPDFVKGVPLTAVEACKIPDTLNVKVVQASPEFAIDTIEKPLFKLNNLSDPNLNVKYEWLVRRLGTSNVLYSYSGDSTNPNYQFDLEDDTGTYEVCLTSYAKGISLAEACMDSTCQIVSYLYVADFQIPNVFTPDGDSKNDVFKALVKEGVSFKLTIYNRWGAKVFESEDPETAWNGKSLNEGAECPAGVYYYICDYKLRGQEDKTRTGTVTLIR